MAAAISPTEYETRIRQLEKLNATLAAEIDAQRAREQALSAAYLRLRRLIGRQAFDTPHGPTGEQVWTTTENALAELVAEMVRMRAVVEAVRPWRHTFEIYKLDTIMAALDTYEAKAGG